MANPLKFEIAIGSQLAKDIAEYTKQLNTLISKFNGTTIKIGVDDKLTQIVTALTEGFKNINTQQAEGLKTLKSVTEMLEKQQSALSGSVSQSKQSAEAASKEADAYKKVAEEKEKAASAGGKANGAPVQLDWLKDLPKEDAIKNVFDAYVKTINTYSTQINEALKKMTEGVDVEAMTGKFRQSVEGLVQVMEPLQKMLTMLSSFGGDFAKVVHTMAQATNELKNSLTTVNEAQKKTTTATGDDKEAKDKASEGIKTYFNNIVKLERALVQLEIAEKNAEKNQRIIAANGGDTSDIQKRITQIDAVRSLIQTLRDTNKDDILGQKGSMVNLSKEVQDLFLAILKDAPDATAELNSLAQSLGKSKITIKDLLDIIGGSGPLGTQFVRALARDDFDEYARKLAAAAPKVKNAEQDMADAAQKLESVIARSGSNTDVSKLQNLQEELYKVKAAFDRLKGTDKVEAANLLDATYTKLIQNIKAAVAEQEKLLSNTDKLFFIGKNIDLMLDENGDGARRMAALYKRYSTLTDEQVKTAFLGGFGDSEENSVLERLAELRERMSGALNNPELMNQKGYVSELVLEFNKLATEYRSCWSQVEKLASAQDRLNRSSSGLTEEQKQMKDANEWLGAIIQKMAQYHILVSKAQKFNLDTTDLEKAIAGLEKWKQQAEALQKAGGKLDNGATAAGLKANPGYVTAKANAEMAASALQLQYNEAKAAASETQHLTAEQQRLASAMRSATGAAQGQSQVLSDLKGMMAQYFSVYGAQQFLTEMANITGELELQRKSLEVILGSGSAASEMYAQLRDLSQESPYTFEDLLKSHRQLAAFGIEAKDIYGTMKSLTDIGAGLDVDISRLILAYGHTKSYGYLSGIQNRQFETAGIDLVGALAKHYNDLADAEEKAGRAAEHVSRKDIFARMRTRDIPFEDVQKVIMELDQPGGKFYNMQERQYNTLGGKLRNLRNNYRIMMSEMGQAANGFLSGAVDTINTVTEKWSKFAQVIEDILIPLGAMRLAMLAINKAGAALPNSIAAKTLAELRRTAAMNAARPTGFWSGIRSGLGQGVGSLGVSPSVLSQFSKGLQEKMADGELTKNMALQLAYSSQLPSQLRQVAAGMAGLSEAEAAAAARTHGFNRAVRLLRVQLTGIGSAIGGFLRSMASSIFNPQTVVAGAAIGISSIINWYRDRAQRIERISEETRSNAERDLETISGTLDDMIDRYGKVLNAAVEVHTSREASADGGLLNDSIEMVSPITRDGVNYVLDETAVMADGVANIIEELDKKLQVLDPLYKGDMFDVKKFQNQYAQAQEMVGMLSDLELANRMNEKYPNLAAEANSETGGMFSDTYAVDIKDYQKAVQKRNTALLKIEVDEARAFLEKRGESIKDLSDSEVRNYLADYLADENNLAEARRNPYYFDPKQPNIHKYFQAFVEAEAVAKELENEIPVIAQRFEGVWSEFNGNARAFGYYVRQQMNRLFADSDFKVTDTDAIEEQYLSVYGQIAEDMGGEVSDDFNRVFAANMMSDDVVAELKKQLGENGKLSEMTTEEAKNLTDKVVEVVRERLSEKAPKWAKLLAQLFLPGSDELDAALNKVKEDTADFSEVWKQEAQSMLKGTAFEKLIKSAADLSSFIDDAKKEYKETTEVINKLRPYFKMKIGVDIQTSEQAKKNFPWMFDGDGNLLLSGLAPLNYTFPNGEKVDSDEARNFYEELLEKEKGDAFSSATGIDLSSNKKTDNSQENQWRKDDRMLIRNLQNRQKNLSAAYKTYWDWYERLGNDEQAAMARVREKFTTAQISNEDLKNLQTQEGYIKSLSDTIKQVDEEAKKLHYQEENKDTIENIKVSLSDTIDQTRQKQFDDAAKKYTSELDLQVKDLQEQYELYQKIYELTGDMGMALRLSGRSASNPRQSEADDLREAIRQNLSHSIAEMQIPNISDLNIDFSKVRGLSDEGITSYVGQLFNEDANGELIENNEALQTRIEGIVEKLKEWRDLQKQIRNEGIQSYADLIGGLQDYDSVVARNNAEYERTVEQLGNAGLSDEERKRGEAIADQERLTKNLQASIGYISLMNNAIYMGETDYVTALADAYEDLTNRLDKGTISVSDFASEMRKLDDIDEKRKAEGLFGVNNGTTAFLSGGLPGLQSYYKGMIDNGRRVLANMGLSEEAIESNPYMKKLQNQLDKVSGLIDKAGDLSLVTSAVIGVFDGLRQSAQDLSTMFDALGNEHMANFFSDLGDVIGGISSIITPVDNILKNATSGNVSGMVSSVISAPVSMITSPITAFSQLHDKKRERAIERIQQDVTKIESQSELLNKLQQRSMGNNTNTVLRIYQTYYANDTQEGAAGRAMAAYYNSAGGSDLSSYQQQYNLLVSERQKYIDMYNTEDSKKKKSKQSLEEYKQKIAELDDEIQYFAEDMANDLYGIDLKSWADQFGDALMTAFENGEDAAEAFDDTVTSILQGLVKNMITVNILQPLLEQLQKALFGYTDDRGVKHAGSFDINNPEGTKDAWMTDINDALGDNGYIRDGIGVSEKLFNAFESFFNGYGNTMMNSNSSTMSSSIKGITEQTAELLASYVNAIRGDVSVIRQLQASRLSAFIDSMSLMAQSQVQQLSQIAQNTLRSADAAERIVQTQNDILYIFNAVVNDAKQFNVRVK